MSINTTGKGPISADDPNAIEKLNAKRDQLQALQDRMKVANAYYRKHKTLDGCPQLSAEQIEKLKVAQHKSIILFLRLSDNVDKPFYTIEVRNQKAVQVRGMQNADMTPAVERFIHSWERQVLQRQDSKATFEAA